MNVTNLCVGISLCLATLLTPESCTHTLPAFPVSIGYLNVSYDPPSNWVFTPPGSICGDSFVSQDGIRSNFTYIETICITSFSPLLSELIDYLYIQIGDIGQEIVVSRRPFTYQTIPAIATDTVTHTKSSLNIVATATLSPLERCFLLFSTFTDPSGEVWPRMVVTRTVCGVDAMATYSLAFTLTPNDITSTTATHVIYTYVFGGPLSQCEDRTYCLDAATSLVTQLITLPTSSEGISAGAILALAIVPSAVVSIIASVIAYRMY